jgi:hypothetical protein
METINQSKPIELNSKSIAHLAETRKWTMFMSILGLIGIGLLAIIFLYLLTSAGSRRFGREGILTVLPLFVVCVIYFFPIYYLIKFSIFSKKAIINSDSQFLETALKYLKLHYRFMGILIIIMICIYIIIGIIALTTYMGRF